jgi:hypothetical protein
MMPSWSVVIVARWLRCCSDDGAATRRSHNTDESLRTTFRRLLNLWPPFLCNSIRVQSLSEDYSEAHVVLRLRPWNRNYVRSQFGGNLFAMTDPFWMLLVMHQLGNDYYVWDKAGAIDFVAPGVKTSTPISSLKAAWSMNCVQRRNGRESAALVRDRSENRWRRSDRTRAQADLRASETQGTLIEPKPNRATPAMLIPSRNGQAHRDGPVLAEC